MNSLLRSINWKTFETRLKQNILNVKSLQMQSIFFFVSNIFVLVMSWELQQRHSKLFFYVHMYLC